MPTNHQLPPLPSFSRGVSVCVFAFGLQRYSDRALLLRARTRTYVTDAGETTPVAENCLSVFQQLKTPATVRCGTSNWRPAIVESRRQPRLSTTAPCVSANPKRRPPSSSIGTRGALGRGEEAARLAQSCLLHSASKRPHRCYWAPASRDYFLGGSYKKYFCQYLFRLIGAIASSPSASPAGERW